MTFPAMTPLTAALFDLPPTAQRISNLCSMVNFHPEAGRIMDGVGVTHIVEIGCEDGVNTAALFDYARSRGAKLTAVDPAAVAFPPEMSGSDVFFFYRGTSRNFLGEDFRGEIVFMDGDHNYESVKGDLEIIDRNKAASGIKIVFMHDVSWPWARRDNYYDLTQVREPHPNGTDVNISPYDAESDKFYLPPFNYSIARAEGGERNGVLTAVEDFLAEHESSWRFWRIPIFYGIGILCCTDNLSADECAAVENAARELASHREILATLEANRIENLCLLQSLRDEIGRAGAVWNSDQEYIKKANLSLSELSEKFESSDSKIAYLQSLVSEKDSRIGFLSASLDRSVANESFQKELCAKLTRQMEEERSDREVARNERVALENTVGALTEENKTAFRKLEEASSRIGELSAERAAAEEQKNLLQSQLSAERAAAEEQKNLLQSQLSAERAAAEEQKNLLQSQLTAERTAAEEQKNLLQSQLSAERAAAEEQKNALESQLSAERVAAEEQKNALESQLSAERVAAEEQKNALESQLSAERAAAEEQKNALESQLSEKEAACAEVSRELGRCQDSLQKSRDRELSLEVTVWGRDQELRRMRLDLASERWRIRGASVAGLLPCRVRNRERLRRIGAKLDAREVDVLSLDVFDTLLLREFHSELRRFREIASAEAARYPDISVRTFYEARALAHQLTYRGTNAVQGCREPRAAAIFGCMANILALPGDAAEVLSALELRYEVEHLRANPVVCALVRRARQNHIPVIAVSDMYWSGEQIMEILKRCLPADAVVDRVYCSSDFGVSKASGLLYDRVLKERNCRPERLLHLGDNRDSDCVVPFLRHGIDAVWLPRSGLYNRYCARQQRKMMEKLKSAGVVNGI